MVSSETKVNLIGKLAGLVGQLEQIDTMLTHLKLDGAAVRAKYDIVAKRYQSILDSEKEELSEKSNGG